MSAPLFLFDLGDGVDRVLDGGDLVLESLPDEFIGSGVLVANAQADRLL